MNSALIRKQKREARLDFVASLLGWSIVASISYFILISFFWLLTTTGSF